MIWEFSVFFISLIYAGILWFAYNNPANFIWPGLIFFILLLVAVKLISKRYFYFTLPAIISLGAILLLPLIDSSSEAKAFIVISAGVFYLAILASFRLGKYGSDKTAKGMSNLAALAALFTWFAAGYGWYLNVQMPIWPIMIIFAIVTFLISYVSFGINQLKLNSHQRFLYAVFMAYLMAGVIWMQNFWPFGYLTTGAIALIIYYSGWDLIVSYFRDKLSIKRLAFDIIFLVGASAVILLSAKWYPAI
jgi:hypothetical protein